MSGEVRGAPRGRDLVSEPRQDPTIFQLQAGQSPLPNSELQRRARKDSKTNSESNGTTPATIQASPGGQRQANPDIQDIITGIVKLLKGNVIVNAVHHRPEQIPARCDSTPFTSFRGEITFFLRKINRGYNSGPKVPFKFSRGVENNGDMSIFGRDQSRRWAGRRLTPPRGQRLARVEILDISAGFQITEKWQREFWFGIRSGFGFSKVNVAIWWFWDFFRINNRGPPRISEAQLLPLDLISPVINPPPLPTYEQPPAPHKPSINQLPPNPPGRPFVNGIPIPEQIVPQRPWNRPNRPGGETNFLIM